MSDFQRCVQAMEELAEADTLNPGDADAMLRAALAVRVQCETCGGTGLAFVNTAVDGLHAPAYRNRCCPSCGGAPLPVLVPSARLEQAGWASTYLGIYAYLGTTFQSLSAVKDQHIEREPVYRLRQEGDEG